MVKCWVINPDFSYEFNGTELDKSKWLDHHPTSKGRPRGLFMPSQVSISDGFLHVIGEKMEKDTVVGNVTFSKKSWCCGIKKIAQFGCFTSILKAPYPPIDNPEINK